jgi:hypothetical protein
MSQPFGCTIHSFNNTLLNFHEPIHSFPLCFHVHLALKKEPLEVRDLDLELNLQKNLAHKFNKFNNKNDESIGPHLFEMMRILHIKTLLTTQRR